MNAISKIRQRLEVTQEAMATGIGVTQGNVSNYERGQNMPPQVANKLIAYAKELGHVITFNDVYGMSDEAPSGRRKEERTQEQA